MKLIRERLKDARRDRVGFLTCGDLSLIFEKGAFRLLVNDKEVTRGHGAYSSILSQGIWIDSVTADWRVESQSENELVAIGNSRRIPIRQIWRISLESASSIRWSVDMEVEDKATVSRRHVSLLLPTDYTKWLTENDSGEFPMIRSSETEWIHLTHRDERVRFMAAIPDASREALPFICVEAEELAPRVAFHVINSSYAENARVLQVLELQPGDRAELMPGKQKFASVVIQLERSEQQLRSRLQEVCDNRMVSAGNLSGTFDNGRVRLLWKDTEVTRERCVFASVRSGDLWDESSQGRWHVERVSDAELRATGMMFRLPAVQEWTLKGCEDGTLALDVVLDVKEKLQVHEVDVGAMLLSEYGRWATAHESGTFPEPAGDTTEWEPLTRVLEPSSFIEAGCTRAGEGVPPTVRLAFEEPRIAIAANTGSPEQARVIHGIKQYAEGSGVLSPGRHLVFSGRILVGKD
jgi:hypothetical protein